MLSSICNSLEDWAPVDEIYMSLIFKWVAEIGHQDGRPSNGHQGNMPSNSFTDLRLSFQQKLHNKKTTEIKRQQKCKNYQCGPFHKWFKQAESTQSQYIEYVIKRINLFGCFSFLELTT